METRLDMRKVLTDAEEAAILAEADRRLYGGDPVGQREGLTVWLALTLGLRVSELARLRWSDFDFETHRVDVWRHKKGCGNTAGANGGADQRDSIYPANALFQRLAGFARADGADGPVFGGIGKRMLQAAWRGCAIAAGLRSCSYGIHSARHTAATRIARASGGDIPAVRDFLGHSDRSIGITAQYVGRDPERLREISDRAWAGREIGPSATIIERTG